MFRDADGDYVTKLGLSEDQGGFAGDPILGVVKQIDLGVFQGPGEIYVGLLAATILFIATNAGIIGVSRLVYSMGLHRQVPDRLRQLHPRYGTPWIGIMLFGAIACVMMIPGQAAFLGNIYAFGAMLSFTIAHLAVIKLRISDPDRPRPYRGPGTLRVAGRPLPLFAVLGGIGTGLAFVVVTFLHLDVAAAGVGWLALGMVIYPLYRRRQGLDLTTTTKVAVPKPVVDHEAEYESVLVALDGREYSPGAMATAIKLAARRRRGIHVLVTDHRAAVGADRGPAARAGARRPGDHRAGQAPGRPARLGALGEGPRRPGGPPHRPRGAGDARAGHPPAAAAAGRAGRCSARPWRRS